MDSQKTETKTSNLKVNVDGTYYPLKAGLLSYPRCGNTFIRQTFVQLTGNNTSEDNNREDKDHAIIGQKFGHLDMRGLGIDLPRDENVEQLGGDAYSYVKTHFPWWVYPNRKFVIDMGVLIVRNPFDTFESMFNQHTMLSQHKSVPDWVYIDYSKYFDDLVIMSSNTFNTFHSYWCEKVTVPVFITRYEDLMSNQEEELTKVYSFLSHHRLSTESLNYKDFGEFKERIKNFAGGNGYKKEVYKPRRGGGVLHTILEGRYTSEQLDFICKTNSKWLNFFDYFNYFIEFFKTAKVEGKDKEERVRIFLEICEKYRNINNNSNFVNVNTENEQALIKSQQNSDTQTFAKIGFDTPDGLDALINIFELLTPLHEKIINSEKYKQDSK